MKYAVLSLIFLVCTHSFATVTRDANGWTVVTPSSDTQTIYVSSSSGNDSNNGLSQNAPKKTIGAAKALMRSGFPDWVLLKRGDVWYEDIGTISKSGRSAQEPMVFGAYGSGVRPLIKATNYGLRTVSTPNVSFIVVKDIHINCYRKDYTNTVEYVAGSSCIGISILTPGDTLIFENLKIEYGQVNFQNGNKGSYSLLNLQFRRNIVYGNYSFSGHAQGMFTSGLGGTFLLEENIFDHNGWAQNRDLPDPQGGATIFNHNIYIDNENNCQASVVGNIISRASSHGIQLRQGGDIQGNIFIENPLGAQLGGGDELKDSSGNGLGYTLQRNGVFGSVQNNVFLYGADIDSANPRGLNILLTNINIALVSGNIVAHEKTSTTNNSGIRLNVDYPLQPNQNVTVDSNTFYDYYRGGVNGGAQNLVSTNNYFWDLPATGTNHNIQTENIQFVDNSRSVASYNQSIGGLGTTDDFLLRARSRNWDQWDIRLTAAGINSYIRAGFQLAGSKPKLNTPATPRVVQ